MARNVRAALLQAEVLGLRDEPLQIGLRKIGENRDRTHLCDQRFYVGLI